MTEQTTRQITAQGGEPILDLPTAVRELGALPMPTGPEPQPRTILDRARAVLDARVSKDDLGLVLGNVVDYAAQLLADREANDREYEQATARVAELEAQRETLAARLRAGQRWQKGRTQPLVSQDYVSQDELRTIFGIPLVAPWDEDPCHPCGCPKRFDRHADGCPTVPTSYPPVLPWARLMDAEDLEEFLLDLKHATTDHDDAVKTLDDIESTCGTWRLIAEAQHAHNTAPGPDAEDKPTAAPLIVYRASHDSIPMGLYTTAAEARAHCVAEERRTWATSAASVFDWIEDEEDGVAELVTVDEDGETESVTGYVVTALEVAAKYDEEADQ